MVWLFLSALTASSFPYMSDYRGRLFKWSGDKSSSLTYEVTDFGRQDPELMLQAVDIWNGARLSAIQMVPALPGTKADITIEFQANYEGNPASSGFSRFNATDDDGRPTSCEIKVSDNPRFATLDIAKTFLHELGHCLGLGHSLVPKAIMSYRLQENTFALDFDDEVALSRLYPLTNDPQKPLGCAIGSQQKKGPKALLYLLPLIFLAAYRIRLKAISG